MPEIHQEVFIAAGADTIYKAITSSEGLSSWWTPGSFTNDEIGSVCSFPFGENYEKQMLISDFELNRSVKWVCIAGGAEWIDTTISFELISGNKNELMTDHPEILDQLQQDQSASGIILRLKHANWKSYSPMFGECTYTWGRFLRSLKLFCETGKGTPWPQQHVVK